MRYGSRLNTGLFIVLLAAVAVAWFTGRDGAGEPVPVAAFDPAAVASVRVDLPGRAPVELERGPGGWRMTAPLSLEVDARRVDEILNALGVPSRAQYAADEVDLEQVQLDPPLATLAVDGAEFRLGGANPLDGRRYILHDGVIHLADDALYFRLLGDAYSWADRQPLPAGTRIARIETEGTTVARDDAPQRLVDAWAGAVASEVRRADDRPPERVVRVWLEGAQAPLEFGLRVADDALWLVRADAGIEYRMPPADAERFWSLADEPDAGTP